MTTIGNSFELLHHACHTLRGFHDIFEDGRIKDSPPVRLFIAALDPHSLKAVAPWESCEDLYRRQFARDSICAGDPFDDMIQKYMLRDNHGIESFSKMFKQHPLATSDENDWWNDKRPDMKKIKIPTYITGTWTSSMRGMGAIRGWLEFACEEKWLRWHPYQEWYDIWRNPQAKELLFKFMDH